MFLFCYFTQGSYVVKKLVWNVRIKAFWCTKTVVDESAKGSEKNEEESTKDDSEKDGDSQAEEVRYKHLAGITELSRAGFSIKT